MRNARAREPSEQNHPSRLMHLGIVKLFTSPSERASTFLQSSPPPSLSLFLSSLTLRDISNSDNRRQGNALFAPACVTSSHPAWHCGTAGMVPCAPCGLHVRGSAIWHHTFPSALSHSPVCLFPLSSFTLLVILLSSNSFAPGYVFLPKTFRQCQPKKTLGLDPPESERAARHIVKEAT